MSTAVQEPVDTEPDVRCPRCDAPVAAGQAWCLKCGAAARTRIVRAAHWWVPVAIVATLVLAAGLGAAYAVVKLADDAGGSAAALATAPDTTATTAAPAPPASTAAASPAPRTTGATAPTTGAPTLAPSAIPATIRAWPPGRSAYTVVLLATTGTRAGALAAARTLARRRGEPVGVLDSSRFSTLAAGYEIVFSGQYAERAAAERAARRWRRRGTPSAYVRYVSPSAGGRRGPAGGAAAPAPRAGLPPR